MKATPILLSAAIALALSACGNDADDRGESTTGTAAADTAPADTAYPTDSAGPGRDVVGMAPQDPAGPARPAQAGDREALMMVAEVDRHEITAAEDALEKGVEGDVRDYAQTLVVDHTRNLEATERLLGGAGTATSGTGTRAGATGTGTAATDRAGAGVTDDAMPGVAEMREKHEAERETLSGLEGEEFTTAWIEAMVAGHEAALAMLDNELIPGASDGEVSNHLQGTRDAIASHLETARSLQANR